MLSDFWGEFCLVSGMSKWSGHLLYSYLCLAGPGVATFQIWFFSLNT